ncbi:MAG: hypothetical protein MI866_14945 [Bacteroidales bacterium]|nr:hypothetical protein [Bacteroidales bacterium]
MKKIIVIIILACVSLCANAQVKKLINRMTIGPDTLIVVEDYEIKKVESLSDLCLNLAYINHINNNFEDKHLQLPLILINGRIESVINTRTINVTEIKDYALEMKHSRIALYGSKGSCGIIRIQTK